MLSFQLRRQYAGIKTRGATQHDKWPRQIIHETMYYKEMRGQNGITFNILAILM